MAVTMTPAAEEHVVRHVVAPVIIENVLSRELIEDVQMSDDRMLVRVVLKRRGEQELRAHAVGIIETHGELPPDDFLLFGVFILR